MSERRTTDYSDDDLNEAKAHTSRILMSDVLKGVMPDDVLATDDVAAVAQNFTIVILGCSIQGDESPMVGTLDSVMFQEHILELSVKVELDTALSMLKAAPCLAGGPIDIRFNFIELHNGEDITRFEPTDGMTIKGVCVEQVDHHRRMCMLLLNLVY